MRQFLAIESFLKMMNNASHFTLKGHFVLKAFKCFSGHFDHIEKSLIRKIRLISKFMTSQPG